MEGHAEMTTKKGHTIEPLLSEIKTETQLLGQVRHFQLINEIPYIYALFTPIIWHTL